MSPLIAPPGHDAGRRLASAAPSGGGAGAASRPRPWAADDGQAVQALFAEARRRRWRIRLAAGVAVVTAAAVAVALGLAWPPHPHIRGSAGTTRVSSGTAHATRLPLLVWVDASGRVVLGNLATSTKRVVAGADVDWSAPLVPFGGQIYWVKQSGGQVDGAFWPRTIEELNLATGKSTDVGPGEFIFPSADGRHLYISQTDTTLTELPAGARGQPAALTLPAGWYLPGGFSVAVASGIVVQSNDARALARPADLAVWNPLTGTLTLIGRAIGNAVHNLIGAYTPPHMSYSLLAWMPARCRFLSCPITITSTATLSSRTLRSPLGYGFVLGGAFSPDGRQLAVFANTSPQSGGQTAELAIITTATGTVRLVPTVRMAVGEDAAWVRWLPSGDRFLVQARRDYLVTAATLTTRPFRFTGGGQDINFSAELIPPRGR